MVRCPSENSSSSRPKTTALTIPVVPDGDPAGGDTKKRAVRVSSSRWKSRRAERGRARPPGGRGGRQVAATAVLSWLVTVTRISRGRVTVRGRTALPGDRRTESLGTTFATFCFSPRGPAYRQRAGRTRVRGTPAEVQTIRIWSAGGE